MLRCVMRHVRHDTLRSVGDDTACNVRRDALRRARRDTIVSRRRGAAHRSRLERSSERAALRS